MRSLFASMFLVGCSSSTTQTSDLVVFTHADLATSDLAHGDLATFDLAMTSTLATFAPVAFGLSRDPNVAITDIAGAGCTLTALGATPSSNGSAVQAHLHPAPSGTTKCNEGTYAVAGCGSDPFGAQDVDKTCAAYTTWTNGAVTTRIAATGGTITVGYDATNGGTCNVVVDVSFGSGGSYARSYRVVQSDSDPMCTPG